MKNLGLRRHGAFGAIVLLLVAAEAWPQIDEITVTTRRKAENLQDVPLSVTALNAEMIERQGIRDLTDITDLDPSVQFDTSFGPQDTRITVRGLSNTRGRSNVAFLVDGIDVTTENSISAGSGLLANKRLLNDVERIEIVKGPQSALYGRAAFAGAFNYVTKEPGNEFEGQLGIDAGDYGRRQIDGAIGGPIIENILGLRATGVYWSQDGYYQNSVSGNDFGGGEGFGGALTGVFTPTDTIKFKARVEYSEDEFAPPPTIRATYNTPAPYPQTAIDAGIGVSTAFLGAFTALPNFGLYCPELLPFDPSNAEVQAVFPNYPLVPDPDNPGQMMEAPGFCLPPTFGDASDKVLAHSENPLTGEDFHGVTSDVFRASLNATWDIGSFSLTSITGYTTADFTQAYDNDFQARGRPDELLSTLYTDNDQETEQFSQELRLASSFDGPLNVTVGGLLWKEKRHLVDRNVIVSCLFVSKDGQGNFINPTPGLCDGTGGSVSSVQETVMQGLTPDIPGFIGPIWDVDTDHASVYLSIDWEIAPTLALNFETRYVDEKSSTLQPNQASCGILGFSAGALFVPLFNEAENPGVNVTCTAYDNALQKIARGQDPNFDLLNPGAQSLDWALIQGSEESKFNTPKVSLEWQPNDDVLLYTYWARAQKPGGISQLQSGATATTIENERFLPEKMEAWEFGAKTSWDNAAGYLQINGAVFFQNYTDKQTTSQELVNDILQARVTNASAAEVWGGEIDITWQPDFVEGLTLRGGYTYLDASYADFKDFSSILVRAAGAGQCDVVYRGGEGPDPDNLDDPANGGGTCRIDQSGNRLERTPEHAFAGSVTLQRPLPNQNYDWLLELNANYQGTRYLDADNYTTWDPYWMLDLRAGLSGDNWDFIAYVENLLDDDTIKTGGTGPDFGEQAAELGFVAGLGVQHTFGNLPNPRIFGIRITTRF